MKQIILKISLFCLIICGIIAIIFFYFPKNKKYILNNIESSKANIEATIETIKKLPLSKETAEEKNENFNILILGKGGKNHQSGDLTDTLIVANVLINNNKNKITLISIPRDLLVKANPLDINSLYTKINAVKASDKNTGIENLKETIYQITNLQIQHYIEIDFEAFKQTIDTLGCISVYVEKDIYDPLFPGLNFSYEPFSINKGWHCMDGEIALKYVRSRHSAFGDLDRIKRQQQIIEAIKINLLSPQTFFSFKKLSNLLEILNENINTDINLSDIKDLYEITQNIQPENIRNVAIDNSEEKLIINERNEIFGSILLPSEGLEKYDKIKEYIQNIIFNN